MLEHLHNKAIVLGSGSPRRKELLESIGLDFEIRTIDTDESAPADYGPAETAIHIARSKALALLPELKENELLITADTEVWLQNRRFGKASDASEAKEMLTSLSGKTHRVITGFCISDEKRMYSEAVATDVTFKSLSDIEMEYYIDTYSPFDKAGAYGIQEWIGMIGIEKISGSYFNVVGLPIQEVFSALLDWK